MLDLTDAFLTSRPGTLTYWPAHLDHPVADTWTIEIPLAPFSAEDRHAPATWRPGPEGPELVHTEIVLEAVTLPATRPAELSRRTFTFPDPGHDGSIDGSIYLLAAHCPVDATRLTFGAASAATIPVTLDVTFDFAAAGGVDIHNRGAQLHTELHYMRGQLAATPAPAPRDSRPG